MPTAPTSFWDLRYLPHIEIISAGKLSIAFSKYSQPISSSSVKAHILQEDSPDTLHLIASFLLLDGRRNEATFEMMNEEGAFPRLLELIRGRVDDEVGLYKVLLELFYEMSRIQRLRVEDLSEFYTRTFGRTMADRVSQCWLRTISLRIYSRLLRSFPTTSTTPIITL